MDLFNLQGLILTNICITRAINAETLDIVSINEVDSGLQNDVVCACCGARLIANKGKVKKWYFSHFADESCDGAYETQLHLTAKEYFSRVKQIPHPLGNGWVKFENCEMVRIDDVKVEFQIGNRRPDLIATIGSELYWIEIANTHKSDAEKIFECRANSRNMIEIDVSELNDLDEFNPVDGCLIKIQSINVCNDFVVQLTENIAKKHMEVRKQADALRRSENALATSKNRFESEELKLKQEKDRITQDYEREIERMSIRRDSADRILEVA